MPKVEYIYVITAIKRKHGISGPGTTNCSIEFMTTLHKVSMSFPVMKEQWRPSPWHTRLSFKPLLAQTAFFALCSSLFHERSLKWQPVRLVLCVLGHDVAAGVNGGGVRAVRWDGDRRVRSRPPAFLDGWFRPKVLLCCWVKNWM
jgi:hypothetical protein